MADTLSIALAPQQILDLTKLQHDAQDIQKQIGLYVQAVAAGVPNFADLGQYAISIDLGRGAILLTPPVDPSGPTLLRSQGD